MFKHDERLFATAHTDSMNAHNDGDQPVNHPYHRPEVYGLGSLEKVKAYTMIGYPDGWRGYYSRS